MTFSRAGAPAAWEIPAGSPDGLCATIARPVSHEDFARRNAFAAQKQFILLIDPARLALWKWASSYGRLLKSARTQASRNSEVQTMARGVGASSARNPTKIHSYLKEMRRV